MLAAIPRLALEFYSNLAVEATRGTDRNTSAEGASGTRRRTRRPRSLTAFESANGQRRVLGQRSAIIRVYICA